MAAPQTATNPAAVATDPTSCAPLTRLGVVLDCSDAAPISCSFFFPSGRPMHLPNTPLLQRQAVHAHFFDSFMKEKKRGTTNRAVALVGTTNRQVGRFVGKEKKRKKHRIKRRRTQQQQRQAKPDRRANSNKQTTNICRSNCTCLRPTRLFSSSLQKKIDGAMPPPARTLSCQPFFSGCVLFFSVSLGPPRASFCEPKPKKKRIWVCLPLQDLFSKKKARTQHKRRKKEKRRPKDGASPFRWLFFPFSPRD